MTLRETLGRWLGQREVTLPAPPPEAAREDLGLPAQSVQLVYLEGLGWVYQLRGDQDKAIDQIIQAHQK